MQIYRNEIRQNTNLFENTQNKFTNGHDGMIIHFRDILVEGIQNVKNKCELQTAYIALLSMAISYIFFFFSF